MKKIIFTVTNDLVFDQRMGRICDALAKEGFEVLLVGREKKISKKLNDKIYSQKRLKCFFEKGKLFYLEFNLRLFFYLLFKKANVICAIDLDTIAACFLASRFKNSRLYFDAHEHFTEVIELANKPLVKKIWIRIESYVVPKTNVNFTVSENLKRIFEEKYKVRFHLIRNVPLLLEQNEVLKEEQYIIYAGVVNEGRGLEEMIEAMKYINCKLLVCGNGDILEKLIQKVDHLGLNAKVKFLGPVKPEDLRLLISKAYLGILLLRNESLNYYYSLANKFFDYIHAGIPQITSDFPEYRIINEKFKVAELIDLNVENIAKAVNKLLSDKAYYEKLAANTQEAKKVYNWQKESQLLVEIYKTDGNL